VEKSCKLIKEAADNGARLIAFPEGFLPGFASWVYMLTPAEATFLYQKLHANAVEIPGPAVQRISQCAKDNKIYVCMSVNELEGGSLYVTQLWFNPEGDLMGKHRKLRQSCAERIVWGEGDGSTVQVFNTEIGNLGSLECWEHLTPVNLTVMNSLNEQVHVAAWTSFYPGEGIMGPLTGTASIQYYALATQTFVISASAIFSKEMLDLVGLEAKDPKTYKELLETGGGTTRIIAPDGRIISEPIPSNQEGIVYADIDLAKIPPIKYWIDPAGHYGSKVIRILFNQNPLPPVEKIGTPKQEVLTYEMLQQM